MAKSVKIEGLPEFIQVLKKSELLADSQLDKVREKLAGNGAAALDAARLLVKNQLLTKWQASQLLNGFSRFKLGKFTLCDLLGRGELGTVYLAQHEKLGKQVAVKVLSGRFAEEPDVVERFLKEARAAAALDHRNVIQIHDVVTEGPRQMVVMEYVQGQDLKQRVEADGPLECAQAVDFIRQAAEGLGYAHRLGVVHRDVKPANLMVDGQGVVKILDMGVGQLRAAAHGAHENTGEVMLSAISFMSPEQARGREVDPRSDVYSLGGTLYFLLSGRVPYAAQTADERAAMRSSKRPVPLLALRPDLPQQLVEVCERMTSLKPADRYESMEQVVAALAPFSADGTESATSGLVEVAGASTETVESESHGDGDAKPVSTDATDAANSDGTAAARDTAEDEQPAEETAAPANASDSSQSKEDSPAFDWSPEAAKKGDPVQAPKIQIHTGDRSSSSAAPAAFQINTKRRSSKPGSKPAATSTAPDEAGGKLDPSAGKPAGKPAAKNSAADQDDPKKNQPRQPSKTVAAADESAATASDDAKPTASSDRPARSKTWLWVVIGVAAVGFMAMAFGGALAAFLFLRGFSGVEIAQVDAVAETPSEAPADAKSEIDPEDIPYVVPIIGGEPAADEGLPDTAGAVENSAEPTDSVAREAVAGATDVAPSDGETATADTATDSTAATPLVEASDNADAPPGDASTVVTDSGGESTATPVVTTTSDAAASADATPDDGTKPEAGAPAEKAHPAATPRPAAKPKPAVPTFVFEPHVELPPLPGSDESSSSPEPLGKINIGAEDLCFISLSGGNTAARGRTQFDIRNARGGTAPRDWELVVRDATSEAVVATLSLPKDELLFQWTDAAADSAAAEAIRNCALKITAGSEKPQVVALRKPARGESLELDASKPAIEERWVIEAQPDPSAMRIEASLAGHEFVLDPPQPMEAAKGVQWLYVGKVRDESVIVLKLESNVTARNVEMSVRPHIVVPGESPLPLNKATMRRIDVMLAERETLVREVEGLKSNLKNVPAEQRTAAQAFVARKEQAVEALNATAQRLGQLEDVITSLKGARLNIKVIYKSLDGDDVTLLETG